MLAKIKEQFGFPQSLRTFIIPIQAKAAGEVVDVLQIPAYLCMQTTLGGSSCQNRACGKC